MKNFFKLTTTILIISLIAVSCFNAGAVETSHANRQKQFKNTSVVKFKNSADLINLPESYSSKDLGYCTSVKRQTGDMCWNFASISTFETTLLKNNLFSSDLSTSALDNWATTRPNGEGWIRTSGSAGTTLIPLGYFTSRNGPVENTDNNVKVAANAISYYDKGDDSLIKLAIMRTGAVTANYINDGYAYSKNNNAYCLTDPIDLNSGHSVSVVGWDDNYSKENFDGNYTPKYDGAWLCKNSWGTNYGTNGGYLWISYEDYYLFSSDTFDPSFAIETPAVIKESDYLYQNEEFGATYNFSYIDSKDVTYFNVFDFSENGNVLDKVIFETTSLGAKYNVYYVPVDESSAPISDRSKWHFIDKGTVNYNGYICVDAEDTIIPNSKGAIAVEINTDVTKYNVENNVGVSEWLRESGTKQMRFQSTCESGKSFVTFGNKIVDVRDFYIEQLDDYIGGTLVIKALTNGKVDTSLIGDVDYNEKVNITDASLIQKHLAKLQLLESHQLKNADFNGDGVVNILDTTAIQKHIANI
jgi:C1A family cysteine protease